MTELSQAEYAQARKCSPAYVSKLKRQGRLVLTPGGKVNVEATDRLVESTRDPARGGDRRPGAVEPKPPRGDANPNDPGFQSYKEAARRERIAKARLAELELAEAVGQLVRREEVERAFFGLARTAMDALLAMSARLAGPVSAETDPFRCAALIDAEARVIAKSMRESPIAVPSSADTKPEPVTSDA